MHTTPEEEKYLEVEIEKQNWVEEIFLLLFYFPLNDWAPTPLQLYLFCLFAANNTPFKIHPQTQQTFLFSGMEDRFRRLWGLSYPRSPGWTECVHQQWGGSTALQPPCFTYVQQQQLAKQHIDF